MTVLKHFQAVLICSSNVINIMLLHKDAINQSSLVQLHPVPTTPNLKFPIIFKEKKREHLEKGNKETNAST